MAPLFAGARLEGPTVRRALVCLLSSFGFAVLLTLVTLLATGSGEAEASVVELTIPEGAAEAVARGETPVSIPAKLQFQPRSKLLVRNHDLVPHQLAWLVIAPGSEFLASQASLFPGSDRFLCTFHVGGTISAETLTDRTPGFAAVWTTLLLALPLAAVAFGVSTLMSRLDDGEEDAPQDGVRT